MIEILDRWSFWSLNIEIFVFCPPGTLWLPERFLAKIFFCGRFFETRVYETCLLDQIHVSDVPS